MADHSTIEGILERIVYFNEENNFTVAKAESSKLKPKSGMSPPSFIRR